MNGFMRALVTGIVMISLVSCSNPQPQRDDDLALDDTASADTLDGGGGEISDFDDAPVTDSADAKPAEPAAGGDDLSLEDAPTETAEAPAAEPSADPGLSLDEPNTAIPADDTAAAPAPIEETPAPAPEAPPVASTPVEPAPEPVAPAVPEPEAPAGPPARASRGGVNITGIKYKANDNGGTVVIEADGPITYTTRSNPELRQLIVEVPDATLPKRLQRPLNTRDMDGSIGAIDPYQNRGSNLARFVIQLRDGAPEPTIQQEGNTLLLVASPVAGGGAQASSDGGGGGGGEPGGAAVETGGGEGGVLASQSLADFLAGNTKFYGRKVSIETNNMDVRDALRFITEESGVNMVIAEEVKGSVSLKLRQVPWDQALVVLMRAKGLGYSRQGNVLRIATLGQLKQEEDDATKLAQSRRTIEPLKVRLFPVSYADVTDLEKRVAGFLGERGKVVGDRRTNSLVITDIEDNLNRVAKLIQSLDIQPPQVLIEGKIVEASEEFTRTVGINWAVTGASNFLTSNASGPVNFQPSLSITPQAAGANQPLNFDMVLGTLDRLGDLTASLSLFEREAKVKVLSSPRIVTLTNETANITQTTEIPIQQVVPIGNTTQTQTTYSFKPLTLKLEVTPQITADASIIMKVNVKREFPGPEAGAGQVPTFSREANTRVLVPNGQTTVIGGIYQNDGSEAETGVPFLRSIPILGHLFKGTNTRKSKSELLIFLTPRILSRADGHAPSTGEM